MNDSFTNNHADSAISGEVTFQKICYMAVKYNEKLTRTLGRHVYFRDNETTSRNICDIRGK